MVCKDDNEDNGGKGNPNYNLNGISDNSTIIIESVMFYYSYLSLRIE